MIAAEKLYKFMKDKGFISIDAKYLSNADLNDKRAIFQAITSGAVPDTRIKVSGVNGEKLEVIDCNAYLTEFKKNPDYNKAYEEFQTAYTKQQKITNAQIKQQNKDEFLAKTLSAQSRGWKIAGSVLCIAGALIAIGSAAVAVYDMYKYYHQEYVPIPRKIVNESSDDKGRMTYTYYDCALCNRDSQGFKNDKLGVYGDMNGDVGKQWLALYTTTDKAAGDPITADIIAQKGSNKAPADKTTGIKLFGKGDTVNLVSEEFCYNDAFKGLYIFCGTEKAGTAETAKPTSTNTDTSSAATEDGSSAAADTSSAAAAAAADDSSSKSDNKAAGSVVGTGTMAISCVGSAAIGALIAFFFVRRKKGDNLTA